jgi:hypothetical protein
MHVLSLHVWHVLQMTGWPSVHPNRPPRGHSYHRGEAGEHRLQAMRLQLGSRGPDGTSLILELDIAGSCTVSVCVTTCA